MKTGGRKRIAVSVVVPTLNEERHVGSLLSDVYRQTRRADEVIVVDAGSEDDTVSVVERFPGVVLLSGSPPVAKGRNLGGQTARGEVLVFLDADVRLRRDFLKGLLREFEDRRLDIACPSYVPYNSTPLIRGIHTFFNALFIASQRVLPSGAGHCIVVRRKVFKAEQGFDPTLKFDDIEFIRRLAKGRRFGIIDQKVYVSDRRYREHGVLTMVFSYLLMSLFFALGKYRWANRIGYEFGRHRS